MVPHSKILQSETTAVRGTFDPTFLERAGIVGDGALLGSRVFATLEAIHSAAEIEAFSLLDRVAASFFWQGPAPCSSQPLCKRGGGCSYCVRWQSSVLPCRDRSWVPVA